jgi:PIN domain nuclease of toxin-antitoxin system
MPYVTDTHALIWFMTADSNLSTEARTAFERTDRGDEHIHIPCIIFFELLYLVDKHKTNADFHSVISLGSSSKNYKIEPLCLPIIESSRKISMEKVRDPWDRLIAATSIYLDLPLITRDESLKNLGLQTIW